MRCHRFQLSIRDFNSASDKRHQKVPINQPLLDPFPNVSDTSELKYLIGSDSAKREPGRCCAAERPCRRPTRSVAETAAEGAKSTENCKRSIKSRLAAVRLAWG